MVALELTVFSTLCFITRITAMSPPMKVQQPKLIDAIPPVVYCNDNDGQEVTAVNYVNGACSNDSDCFGGLVSMTCKNKVCQCADNFEPFDAFIGEKAVQTVCVRAPYLFNKCTKACQKPGTCLPYTGDDAKGQNINICQCAKPFVYKDGTCSLQCEKDEQYDSNKGKCIPRCKANEVRVNDTCKQLANLKDKCESDKQCLPSFSECKGGVCTCKDGFAADQSSSCIPKQVSCPYGDALKDGTGYKKCHSFAPPLENMLFGPPVQTKDDCPKGNFCLVTSFIGSQQFGTGYCCPAPVTDRCPVGSPHPTAQCDVYVSGKGCPYDTHICQRSAVDVSGAKALCCTKGCPSEAILVDDKCYPKIKIGDQCSKNEQCTDNLANCTDGVCKCQPGAQQRGPADHPHCTIECKDDEVLQNQKCEKRLKLSDVCTKSKDICPENAFCNKNNQCACRCGMFTLAENTCAPAPICRPPSIFPFFGGPLAMATSGAAPNAPPLPVPHISDEEKEKLLKNVTFCQVKGKAPPKGAKVADCPANYYCSFYITNLGLCCKLPDQGCFSGQKPKSDKLCNPKEPLSCGLDYSCVKYVNDVSKDESSTDYTACCRDGIQIMPMVASGPVGPVPPTSPLSKPPPS